MAPSIGLCERCNPLGLRDVSASQVHGTVFVAVAVAIVTLAVVARLAVSGIGPFPVTVDAVVPDGDGLAVTLTVRNEGSAEGQTTCRIVDPAARGGEAGAFVLSPKIPGGGSVTFTRTVVELGTEPGAFDVTCRAP